MYNLINDREQWKRGDTRVINFPKSRFLYPPPPHTHTFPLLYHLFSRSNFINPFNLNESLVPTGEGHDFGMRDAHPIIVLTSIWELKIRLKLTQRCTNSDCILSRKSDKFGWMVLSKHIPRLFFINVGSHKHN